MDGTAQNFDAHYSSTEQTGESVVHPHNHAIVEFEDVFEDFTHVFTMHLNFISRERLCEWVRTKGREHGFVIIIGRSDKGCRNTIPRMTLTCERSGIFRESKTISQLSEETVEKEAKKSKKNRDGATKKCGCPFKLKAKQVNNEGEWQLEVVCGVHNHPIATSMVGHSFAGRLMKSEGEYVSDMSQRNCRPLDILHGLKEKYPENKSVIKTIYNARLKNKVNERAGRSEVQQLMFKLQEHGYFHLFRRCEKANTIKDLFFAHPGSIDLLRAFPYVILMDCTYKTNRYKLPLLEIVGVTSTQMTFSVAAAYLEFEKEDNYTWACSVLKSLVDQSCLPTVIITDRELALMNAIRTTFPTSNHFLCRCHINRNIAANCKKNLKTKEAWDSFNLHWNLLVDSDTETSFGDRVHLLTEGFKEYHTAVKYVMEQWIVPYKERFVTYWTNKVMHFENLTTNRVESQHARLKKQLGTSQGSLETCWVQIHKLIETSHVAITHSFEKSKNVVQHKFKMSLFSEIIGMVSMHALGLIHNEVKYLGENGVDALLCRCYLRTKYGLPCPHELTVYVKSGSPIPLSDIHAFWRKLDALPITCVNGDFQQEARNRYNECVNNLDIRFEGAPDIEKTLILRRLTEICNPETTLVSEPEVKVNNKGRPKGIVAKHAKSTKRDPSYFEYVEAIKDSCSQVEPFAFDVDSNHCSPTFTSKAKLKHVRQNTRLAMSSNIIDQFPPYMHIHIERTTDVIGDGHCGFRSIAGLLGQEYDWTKVRGELFQELFTYESLYKMLFVDTHFSVERMKTSLRWYNTPAPKDYWFTVPEMGYLVASAFNVVLVCLSKQLSLTYFPLRTPMPTNPKLICIGLINGDHYIQVHLKEGCPLPPLIYKWHSSRHECAAGWLDFYGERLTKN